MATKEEIIEVLKTVEDPEINMDVWTLGLIYNIDPVDDSTVKIKMTFTSPMCPFGPQIVEEIKAKLTEKNIKTVDVEITFDPPWEPTEELRAILGV